MKRNEPYCLKCYKSLKSISENCSYCGFKNLKRLRRKYWTLDRNLLAIEYTIKALIFVMAVVFTVAALLFIRMGGLSYGWIFLFPFLALAYGLWETTSKITKKTPYFSPTFFWDSAFVLSSFVGLVIDIRITVGSIVLVVLVNIAGYELEKWKHRIIEKPIIPK